MIGCIIEAPLAELVLSCSFSCHFLCSENSLTSRAVGYKVIGAGSAAGSFDNIFVFCCFSVSSCGGNSLVFSADFSITYRTVGYKNIRAGSTAGCFLTVNLFGGFGVACSRNLIRHIAVTANRTGMSSIALCCTGRRCHC